MTLVGSYDLCHLRRIIFPYMGMLLMSQVFFNLADTNSPVCGVVCSKVN
jgi:hypothetical protein